jgi:hypothetical protein
MTEMEDGGLGSLFVEGVTVDDCVLSCMLPLTIQISPVWTWPSLETQFMLN